MKLSILGLGYWGPNLLRVFNNLGVVASAHDLDQKKLDKFSKNPAYKNIDFGMDYRASLLDEDIDAIVIATPPETHASVASSCLLADKHVFIEKPMALKVAEAENLIKLATRQDKIIMVGHTFLYTPEVRKIKEIIDSGELGDIVYIHASRLNLGQFRNVNVVSDLSPHDISIFNYLLGSSIDSIFTHGYSFIDKKIVEVAFMTLEYGCGAVCNLHLSWLDPLKKRTTTIVGNKKMLVYDMLGEEKIKVYDKGVDDYHDTSEYGKYMLTYRHGDIWSPQTKVCEPLFLEAEHFVDCVMNNKQPFTDGKNGLEVVKGFEAALKSLGTGEKIWL